VSLKPSTNPRNRVNIMFRPILRSPRTSKAVTLQRLWAVLSGWKSLGTLSPGGGGGEKVYYTQ